MPNEHARLSPSAAERWLSCPASVRVIESLPRERSDTVYTREGTAAHALAELEARRAFDLYDKPSDYSWTLAKWRKEFAEFAESYEEMRGHALAYVAFLADRASVYPRTAVFLEQRLATGVPSCWGTSDAVLVSPAHVEIVDLKYGQGVPVEAEGNPQLRLYGVAALDTWGVLGDIETVTATVYQPRLGHISSETLTAEEAWRWRDEEVIPVAEAALEPGAPFGPSEAACRWCPFAGRCAAQVTVLAGIDFAEPPEELSPEQIAEQLSRVGFIKQWVAALEAAALTMAYAEQTPIPGWKVVSSGSRRTIPDEAGAIARLLEAGHDPEKVYRRKLVTLSDLGKLLGGDKAANEALGDYITRTEGRPSLVLESDRRKAITPNTEAAKEFAAVDERNEE